MSEHVQLTCKLEFNPLKHVKHTPEETLCINEFSVSEVGILVVTTTIIKTIKKTINTHNMR